MPKQYDLLFAKVAVHNKLLPEEKARGVLAALKPGQSFAYAAVEQELLTRDTAEKLVAYINKKTTANHPAIPREVVSPPATRRAEPPKKEDPPRRVLPRRERTAGKRRAASSLPAVPKRRETRHPSPVPKKGGRKLFLLLAGLVVAAGGTVGLVLALGGKKKEAPVERETVAEKPKVTPKPGPVPKTQPKPVVKKDPPKVKVDPARAALLERVEAARKEAEGFLGEVQGELKEARRREREREEEFRRRFADRRVTVRLNSGQTYSGARVKSFTFDALHLEADEALELSWSLIHPESIKSMALLAYPDRPFERARFLTARKLWKEAKLSFEEAAKKDEDLAAKTKEILPILEKLIAGQGAFHGHAQRLGSRGLLLRYDFTDADQAGDFRGRGVTVSGGAMEVANGGWRLSDLGFTDRLELEMRLTTGDAVRLGFHGCELEIAKDKTVLTKRAPKKAEVATGKGWGAQAEVRVRLLVQEAKVELFLGSEKALAAEIPVEDKKNVPPIGALSFGVRKGKARIAAPLTVTGNVNARDLEKRFAEIEVLIRRATAGDLDDIEQEVQETRRARVLGTHIRRRVEKILANDLTFTGKFSAGELAQYSQISARVITFLQDGIEKDLLKDIDEMLKKHADSPGLHYYRALYHFRIGDANESAKSHLEALRLFPEFFEALTECARAYLYVHQYEKALPLVERALKLRPDDANAYALRGLLRFQRGLRLTSEIRDDLDLANELERGNGRAIRYRRAISTEAKGPRYLGCIYSYESKHYRIFTDISAKAAREYADRLEAAFAHFREYMAPFFKGEPKRKPRVAVFNTREAYYTYNELISTSRSEHTLGIFRQWYDELVLFEDANLEKSLTTLYHEAFHHFMSMASAYQMPYWLNEGIADYMGGIRVEGGRVVQSGIVLKDEARLVKNMLRSNYSLKWKEIMNQNPAQFYSGWVSFKYCQAWTMIHFFHHAEGGKHRALFDEYLRLLHSGKSRKEAWDKVFEGKSEAVEKNWKDYVRGLKL